MISLATATKSQWLHNLSLHAHTAVKPPSNTSSSSLLLPIGQCSTMDPPPPHHNRCDLAIDRQLMLESILDPENKSSKPKDVEEPPIKKCKIVIKIPSSKKREEEIEKKLEGAERIKEESKVVRNLRPRDSIRRPKAADAEVPDRSNGSKSRENCQKTKKKTKDRLSICIPLSKEEIEEDIFSVTGLKPKKKPKKRPRTLQNQLDNLFPGLGLVSISAQSYK